MSIPGTDTITMARPKPKGQQRRGPIEPTPAARTTLINLKGTPEQVEWLEAVHRKTHIPKSVIMRLALAGWAERHGHPPFPSLEDDD